MSITNPLIYPKRYLNDFCRNKRLAKMHTEAEQLEKEVEDLQKKLATDLIEVYDTNLILNKITYVRCIVGGLTDEDLDGIPPGLTEKAHERIMNLANDGARIEVCTGIIKLPRAQMSQELEANYLNNSVDQKNESKDSEGSLKNLKLSNEKNDIEAVYNGIYYNSYNTYDVSYIITIMGERNEVAQTEANVIGVLNSELIEYHIPFGRMLEAFIASRPYPKSEAAFQVRVDSETAAIMCPTTSLNSTIDSEGMLFGKDLKSGMDIVINEQAMAARHRKYFGATGSGKSFTVCEHLFRAITFYDCRGCVITPKHENDNFIALAKYYGKRGKVIYVGETGDAIPTLQIVIDEQSMGDSVQAYSKAYHRHIRTLKGFFTTWFNGGLSDFAKGYLEDTINQIYQKKGIIRTKPETWKNAKWPKLEELREIWVNDSTDESLSVQTRNSAESLAQKTSAIGPNGTYNYLNRDVEHVDYSDIDLLVFDISGVDEEIQDAMNVLITGILGNRFQIDLEKDTIIAVDEARVFLRNPQLNAFLKDGVALGRSYGVWFWLITQNPSDFAKNNADEEFKMNIPISVIMGHDIDKSNIDQIKKYFNFSDSEVEDLLGCEQGDGILRVRGENYPIRFKPTPEEYAIIKGLDLDNVVMPLMNSDEYRIKSEYKGMVAQHHIILKGMIEGNQDKLREEGWIKRAKLPTIKGRGSASIWYKKGEIEGDNVNIQGFGKMTLEHLLGVVESEMFLKENEVKCKVNHNNGSDVDIWINGEPYALEWEMAHSHTFEQLLEKKKRLLHNYKDFRVACASSPDEYEVIEKAIGAEYMAPRGAALMDWLNSIVAKNNSAPVKNTPEPQNETEEEPEEEPEVKPIEDMKEPGNKRTSPDNLFDDEISFEDVQKRLPAFVWEQIYPQLTEEKKAVLVNDIKQKIRSGHYDEIDALMEEARKAEEQTEEHENSENEVVPDVQEPIEAL